MPNVSRKVTYCFYKKIGVCGLALLMFALGGCALTVDKSEGDKKPVVLQFPGLPDEPKYIYERTIRGSGDVVPPEEVSLLQTTLTGQTSSAGNEPMLKPYAVAAHRGRIFVSDSAASQVLVYDIPEKRYFKISATDYGALGKPMGLDVDAAGNLYVADITAKVIHIFDRDGRWLKKIGAKGDFDRLTSVTVDRSGERVYAVDIGGVSSDNHRVRVFDVQTGAHIRDIGRRGNVPGDFNLPRDLAIGKDGRLYVVDGGNFRVQVFDRDGKFLKSWGKAGKQLGDFARPKEIATDASGNVYVIDSAFGNFQIFDSEGELLMFIGSRSESDAASQYMLPSGVFVDEDGRIYVADQWFKKVEIFRPVGLPDGGGGFKNKVSSTKGN